VRIVHVGAGGVIGKAVSAELAGRRDLVAISAATSPTRTMFWRPASALP
jgi:hypothetical protein